ncbi:hypothetical protein [Streptomyces sp. NPDC003077]|uniref:SCO2584 family spore wall biosynthesis protein n=1 Tax=Streptomyces sp. NPDC003077 TaxID=3154443 RepID=UPI0033A9DC01
MPDDMGGRPFPDGEGPDERDLGHHGEADDAFDSVVFDEDFVRSAPCHEPTAMERMLAAARARAEADAARLRSGYVPDPEAEGTPDPATASGRSFGPDAAGAQGPGEEYPGYQAYGPYGQPHAYRGSLRWHRPVAWVLAVLMGIGMVALAFSAVYRGASGRSHAPVMPPASSGVEGAQPVRPGVLPSASADSAPPSAPATPRAH